MEGHGGFLWSWYKSKDFLSSEARTSAIASTIFVHHGSASKAT